MWQQIMAAVRAAIEALKNGGKWVGRQVWDGSKFVTQMVYEPGKAVVQAGTALATGVVETAGNIVSAPFKMLFGGGGGGGAPQGPSPSQQAQQASEDEVRQQQQAADREAEITDAMMSVKRLANKVARGDVLGDADWETLPDKIRENMTRYLRAITPEEGKIIARTSPLLLSAWVAEQTTLPGVPDIRDMLNVIPKHDEKVSANPNWWATPVPPAPQASPEVQAALAQATKPASADVADAAVARVLALRDKVRAKEGRLTEPAQENVVSFKR